MFSSTPKNRRLASGPFGGPPLGWKTLILLGLVLPALLRCEQCGCEKEKTEPPDAGPEIVGEAIRLTGIEGTVEWRQGAEGAWVMVQDGQVVMPGDGLRTGENSSVALIYPDASQITLKGQATVSLSGMEDEFAFLLEQGQIEVTSQMKAGRHYRLLFGETTDYVMLADGQVELVMTSEGVQLRMIMGRATIHQGEEDKTLEAGGTFLLQIGEAKIVEREVLVTTLLDRRRASRIRPPKAKRFRRPGKRSVELEPGTDIRTARRRGVLLKDEAGGKLALGPRSRARFNGAYQQGDARESSIELARGQTEIRLRKTGQGQSSQEVVTAQARIVARASGLTAETDISAGRKATGLLVHSGMAEVTVGEENFRVGAGQSFSVGRNGKTRGPKPVPVSGIRAREGVRTRLFYDRRVPGLSLGWRRGSKEKSNFLELAKSSSFKNLMLREPVEGRSFSTTNLGPGKYYWRIVRHAQDGGPETPGPTGTLVIKQDPVAKKQATGKLTNVVPDTGIQTSILYQGKVPALTFRWDKVENAASYEVRIYSEDDMESPVIYRPSPGNRLVLKAGRLKEGTYFWYQAAKDAQGKELKTSQMNKLVLSFDNAAPLLRIDSPRPGKRPRRGKIQVRGLAPPGARVSVNNRPIQLSPDGRFKQTLSRISRGSLLVFRLRKPGMGDVYFTRRLGR